MGSRTYSFDKDLLLKDAGNITSSAAAQVDGAAKVHEVGDARFDGVLVIDVTAVTKDAIVMVQTSDVADFSSGVSNVAAMMFTDDGGVIDPVVGRYELPFTTEQGDVYKKYMRVFTFIANSGSINYSAFVGVQY